MKLFQYLVTLISYITRPGKRGLIKKSYGLKNKMGLEIGGPSGFFNLKSSFPVYVFAKQVDGVNYSTDTVWEGKIEEGNNYNYIKKKHGYQYISDAGNLKNIKNDKYDFLLSCHSLEHLANPIEALKSWSIYLKDKGQIVLVLPDKNFTFDRIRPYTTFGHLLEDYKNKVTENDDTHFEEIYQLHDIKKDLSIDNIEELKKRTENNFENRCVHHHVYNFELLEELLNYCNFKVLYKQKVLPFHLVVIAEKMVNTI